MIVLTAYGRLKTGFEPTAFELSRNNKELAIKEHGCMRFDYFTSVEDPSKIVFLEEWETMEALNAHFQTPAFASFLKGFRECLDGEPEIRVFQASLIEG